MKCNEAISLLSQFHDGELDFEQRQAVAAHLRSCVDCSRRLDAIRSLSDLAARTPSPAPPATLVDRVQRGVDSGDFPKAGLRLRLRPRLVVAALAASAAALLGGLVVRQLTSEPPQSHSEMVRVFGEFLNAYEQGQPMAADVLAEEYGGTSLNEAEATSALKRKTVARQTVLSDHQAARRYLLKMPCCDCVQTIYARDGRISFVVFEHEQEELEWFGARPMIHAQCRSKTCCVVQLKGSLAASWRVDSGYVTVVGVRDLTQIDEFVDELRPL